MLRGKQILTQVHFFAKAIKHWEKIRVLRTIGTLIMFINVPDPRISATVSISPIPVASANDVDTAGRNLLSSVTFSGGIGNSDPK
jgi:hypothetical protein